MTVAEVVDLHLTSEHEVVFLGFAPGFAYIGGLPEERPVPPPRPPPDPGAGRLGCARSPVHRRVSTGHAGRVAVDPGRTTVPLWDPAVEPASYLLPGDRVRFTWVRP